MSITEEDVFEALRAVEDPELGMDVVDLGLVYDVRLEPEKVTVTYSLTSMGLPGIRVSPARKPFVLDGSPFITNQLAPRPAPSTVKANYEYDQMSEACIKCAGITACISYLRSWDCGAPHGRDPSIGSASGRGRRDPGP